MSELAIQLIKENKAKHARGEDATYLDLGNCGLTELPPELGVCTWLEELVLSDEWVDREAGERKNSQNTGELNNIHSLEGIQPLKKLKRLIVAGDWLTEYELADLSPVQSLKQLVQVDCSHTQVKDLAPLANLQNLNLLKCSSAQVADLGPLSNLQSLNSLDCSSTQVADLGPLSNLQSLNSLDCSSTQVADLGPLSNLQSLKELRCSDTQVKDLGPLAKLQSLNSLNCSYTQVKDLGPLAKLQSLKELRCSSTQVKDLEPLAKLQSLNTLNCTATQVKDLGPLANLQSLKELQCSETQVKDLGPLTNLQHLEELQCYDTQVKDLCPLAKLQSLKLLHCYDTQVKDLGPLAKLQSLEELVCSETQVKDLAPLANLQNLEELDCNSTQVKDLGPLANLQSLKELYCRDTQVKDLGPLANLQSLKELYCRDTQVSNLGPLRAIVNQLSGLYLSGNPITYVPKEIYEQRNCAYDLQSYWKELDHSQAVTNKQLKVMFLGNGCVGKTTLLHWFIDNAFREISLEEGRTHGIIIQPYSFPDSDVLAHFWDFGGQEIYHATHRLFLGRRTLYLMVWATETPEKEEELRRPPQYWLDMIVDVADPHERSRVLIIQNLFPGQRERHILTNEELADYEEKGLDISTQSVNAKEGKGIKALKAAVEEHSEELIHTYQEALPGPWVEIRKKVAERKLRGDRTLDLDTFKAICQESKLKGSPRVVLRYLHRAGELFHYEQQFGGQIILDQQWALKAVYVVLKKENIDRYEGEFRLSDLVRFWRELHKELTTEEANIFLNFMLQNQIAFYVEEDSSKRQEDPRIIIPQLLPDEKPFTLNSWQYNPDKLQHRIRYAFLHRDIIERFIVQTAYLSTKKTYWRQGVSIDYEGGQAVVEAIKEDDDDTRFIQIECVGPGKESLLKKIREQFEKIRPLSKASEYQWKEDAWQPYLQKVNLDRDEQAGFPASTAHLPEAEVRAMLEQMWQKQHIAKKLRLFISYSRHDTHHKDTLLKHLSGLRDQVVTWHDRDILPGEDWDGRIKAELNKADIVLYLVTHHSMATDYIQQVELPFIQKRCDAGECTLVPVIVDYCKWQRLDFAKQNALPDKGNPITSKGWDNENHAWLNVLDGVERLLEGE
jgi:internalin A